MSLLSVHQPWLEELLPHQTEKCEAMAGRQWVQEGNLVLFL